jgi:hypothetical protein
MKRFFYTSAFIVTLWSPLLQASNNDLPDYLESYLGLRTSPYNKPHEEAMEWTLFQFDNIDPQTFDSYTTIYQNAIELGFLHQDAVEQIIVYLNDNFSLGYDDEQIVNEGYNRQKELEEASTLEILELAALTKFKRDFKTYITDITTNEATELPEKFRGIFSKSTFYHTITDESSFSGSDMERKLYDSIFADLEDDIFQTEKSILTLIEPNQDGTIVDWQKNFNRFYKIFALRQKLRLLEIQKEDCEKARKIIEAFTPLHKPLTRINELYERGSVDPDLERRIIDLREQFTAIKEQAYLEAISPEEQINSKVEEDEDLPYVRTKRPINFDRIVELAGKKMVKTTWIKDFNSNPNTTEEELWAKLVENNIRSFTSNIENKELGHPPLDDDSDDRPPRTDLFTKKLIPQATIYGHKVYDQIEKYLPQLRALEESLSEEDKEYREKLIKFNTQLEKFLKHKNLNQDEQECANSLQSMATSLDKSLLKKDEKNLLLNLEENLENLKNLFKKGNSILKKMSILEEKMSILERQRPIHNEYSYYGQAPQGYNNGYNSYYVQQPPQGHNSYYSNQNRRY